MNKFTKLVDEICNDNDYLFTFQVQEETRILVKELIKLRDSKVDTIEEVSKALNSHIEILNKEISDAKDEVQISYFQDILFGLEESRKRLDAFETNKS